ncbi:MAG: hypothetical protein AAGA99_27390 [Actinomycetota bacterium]
MAARQITRGRGEGYFLATAPSNLAAPTQAEITAGTRLTPSVRAIEGFDLNVADLDTADLSDDFDKTGNGAASAPSSSVTLYRDDDGTAAILTAMAEDTVGYLVFAYDGLASAKESIIWPVQVKVHNHRNLQAMNEAPTVVVQLGLQGSPTIGTQAA